MDVQELLMVVTAAILGHIPKTAILDVVLDSDFMWPVGALAGGRKVKNYAGRGGDQIKPRSRSSLMVRSQ